MRNLVEQGMPTTEPMIAWEGTEQARTGGCTLHCPAAKGKGMQKGQQPPACTLSGACRCSPRLILVTTWHGVGVRCV